MLDIGLQVCGYVQIPGTVVRLSYSELMSAVNTLEKTFVSNKNQTIIYHLHAVFLNLL